MIVLISLVLCIAILVAPVPQVQRGMVVLLILSLTVASKVLATTATQSYVGIAPRAPTLYTFSLLTVVCLFGSIANRPAIAGRALRPWLPFLAVAYWEYSFVWPKDHVTQSGALQLGLGICCFVVGFVATRTGVSHHADLPRTFYFVLAIEIVFIMATFTGHPLYTAKGPQASDLAGRMIGTTNHPDQLGKLALIAMVAIMTYQPSGRREKRLQISAIVLGLAVVALAESRAAFFAAVAAIAMYTVLKPDRAFRQRHFALVGGVVVIGAAASGNLIARFQQDPSGGDRGQLTSLALRVISEHMTTGVGLNHYVDVVGAGDPLTASGVPVHDAYLLMVAEIGFVAGCLVWLPFIWTLVIAARNCRRTDQSGVASRAYLAIVPGLVLTGITGWGILQGPTFELLCIVVGASAGLIEPPIRTIQPQTVRQQLAAHV